MRTQRSQRGNMLILGCISIAFVALLMVLGASFGGLAFIHNRLQSTADETGDECADQLQNGSDEHESETPLIGVLPVFDRALLVLKESLCFLVSQRGDRAVSIIRRGVLVQNPSAVDCQRIPTR